MAVEVHCPRCNAVFAASSSIQIGQRVPCPRCDASFTVLQLHEIQTPPSGNGLAVPARLPRPLTLTSQRTPAASWRPEPAALLELFEGVLVTVLLGILLLLDGRSEMLGYLLGLNVLVLVSVEFLRLLHCLLRRQPIRPFLLARDRHRFFHGPRLYCWLVLVELLVVVLTLPEGSEALKVGLILGTLAVTGAVRLALSLADFTQLPRMLGIGAGALLVGLGAAWFFSQRLSDYTDHRYFVADVVLCLLALVTIVRFLYTLLRIQDVQKFRLACTIVGVMTLMMSATMLLARTTVERRRTNDLGLVDKKTKRPGLGDAGSSSEPVRPVPPLQLEALRWLPRDTVVIASVHAAEVLDQGGKAQLEQPLEIGPLSVPVNQLENWTGLKPQEIDHVVFGVRGGKGEWLPRFVTVVRTRRPYDPAAVRAKFKNITPHAGARKQGVFLFRLETRPPFNEGMLRSPDERTLLIDWQQSDLGWITDDLANDASQLPKEVREIIAERMKPAGPIWIAGHAEDWTKAFKALTFLKFDKTEQELLTGARTFVVWTPLEPRNTWLATIRCADKATAEKAKTYLESRLTSDSRRVTLILADEWLTVQVQPKK